MADIYRAFQEWTMIGCLALLFYVLVPALLLIKAWPVVRDAWSDAMRGRSLATKAIAVVFLSITFYLGATKPSAPRVTYDGGIKAGTTSNVVTNDTVAIYWQRDVSGGVIVPESAAVYIDYRERSETNGVWNLLAETTVGAWSWTGTVQNATNYDYNVWAYYIPPTPVHTNGVWTYKTVHDRTEGRYALPLRSRVEVNGKAIATPKEVRRDEEND